MNIQKQSLYIKTIFFTFILLFHFYNSVAQSTAWVNTADKKLNDARDYFYQKKYSLALPLLESILHEDFVLQSTAVEKNENEVQYFLYACRLMIDDEKTVPAAQEFIKNHSGGPFSSRLSFYLAQYYFRRSDFSNASEYYTLAGIAQLSNEEIIEQKFRLGYCLFLQKKFDEAKPLFDAVRQIKDNLYQADAEYYFGFISFYKKNYADALQSFESVAKKEPYNTVVPFYISSIHFLQGNKSKALEAGEAAANDEKNIYANELKQLIGHAYFENKNYAKALPLLKAYSEHVKKLSNEEIYELSYSYYQLKMYQEAAEGLKQLSNGEDSLSMHAMYVLADIYLKTDDKINARNAFSFCASASNNNSQKEIALFNYAKLSFELGFQDAALSSLQQYIQQYPSSTNVNEAKDLLIQALAATSNYKDALNLLKSFTSFSDASKNLIPKIYYGRAVEFFNDGELAQADSLLNIVLSDKKSEVYYWALFWKGEIAYRFNKIEQASQFYTQFLAGGKFIYDEITAKEAKYNLGYCFLRKENYSQAKSYFEQVAKSTSLSVSEIEQDAYLRMADCNYMLKDYKKASTQYEAVIQSLWSTADYAMFQKAMIAGITKPVEKIKLLIQLQRLYLKSEWVNESNLEIATTFIADEKFKDAIPYLTNIINETGNNLLKPKAYLRLGLVYNNINKEKEALETYQKLIKIFPNTDEAREALENIKSVYIEIGKTDEYAAFIKSVGMNMNSNEADSIAFAAAELKYSSNSFNEALPLLLNYIQKFPQGNNIIDAGYFAAECYARKNDFKNASIYYELVLEKGRNRYAENAALKAARIFYFEEQNFSKAEILFEQLQTLATSQNNQLEALRGLLRSRYQLKKYKEAGDIAKDLLNKNNISNDDKALANLVAGKNYQLQTKYDLALNAYKQVINLNKGEWAAEARFETAQTYFLLDNLTQTEKSGMEVIKKSGSYDYWVTKAYILLGDVYAAQKDYFNAKATYKSVADNAIIIELKNEAKAKYQKLVDKEGGG